jgi:LAO/AO transport system kinase
MSELDELLAAARSGDKRSLARLISAVERSVAQDRPLGIAELASARSSLVVGVTGAPGAGKSTLVDRLIGAWRATGRRIGIVAVDPSSPFSGGAILGDRVRMQSHTQDEGVFIRSVATRGALGGLARAVPAIVALYGAVGFDLVVIETVGVGQVEVEIVQQADVTVVVMTPGWGDSIQANKAGIMEIGDIFVINKADRPGLAETRRDVLSMLELGHRDPKPLVVETVATTGQGCEELARLVLERGEELRERGVLAERLVRRRRLALQDALARRVVELANQRASDVVEGVEAGRIDVEEGVVEVLGRLGLDHEAAGRSDGTVRARHA